MAFQNNIPFVIPTKRLTPGALFPRRMTRDAAAYDLFNPSDGGFYTLKRGESMVIPTGLAMAIPLDYVLKIYSRSGHGFNWDITLANSVGIFDADYRGELKIKLSRTHDSGELIKMIEPGDAIAQCILVRRWDMVFDEVEELSETERGEQGFGHTG